AASQISIDSRVFAATPPSVPEAGEGRTNALASLASRGMRVLSARIEPPLRADDGSTARTATWWPLAGGDGPGPPVGVGLPTPGGPGGPTGDALPVKGQSARPRRRAAL